MTSSRRLRELETSLYRTVRSQSAASVVSQAVVPWDVEMLREHKCCLVVSYRRNGAPVATPVWFGLTDERLYFRSAATDGKIKRIRRDPTVLIAPCTFRGEPRGAPVRGAARLLLAPEEHRAEEALRAHYGLGRRLYGRTRAPLLEATYIEVSPPPRPT